MVISINHTLHIYLSYTNWETLGTKGIKLENILKGILYRSDKYICVLAKKWSLQLKDIITALLHGSLQKSSITSQVIYHYTLKSGMIKTGSAKPLTTPTFEPKHSFWQEIKLLFKTLEFYDRFRCIICVNYILKIHQITLLKSRAAQF